MDHKLLWRALLATTILVSPLTALAAEPAESEIDQIFAAYNRPDSPGCAFGIYRDGRLALARGYGRANLELDTPITPRSVFDIGSTSKQFTAAAIALLAEDKKLSLDDDVRRFIPELPNYGHTITLRHLLNHTSGLRDYLSLMDLAGIPTENWTTEEDALALIVRQKASNFVPGERWAYSNTGFFLLSQVVKRVSGQSLRQFAEEQIFKPLGMVHSHFHDDHGMIVLGRATAYAPAVGGFRIDMSNFEQLGDGAVMTTVEDLLLWDNNFYRNRLGRTGNPNLIRALAIPGRLAGGETLDYGLGLVVGNWRGLPTVSHGGSWAGYRAELLRVPGEKFAVACLCNVASADPSALARRVGEVYLGSRLPAPPAQPMVKLDTARVQLLLGAYRDVQVGTLWQVVLEAGQLTLKTAGASARLVARSAEEFQTVGLPVELTVRFEPGSDGRSMRLVRVENARRAAIFESAMAYAPTAAELTALTGEYRNSEVGASATVEAKDGKLQVAFGRRTNTTSLTPTVRDGFYGSGIALDFDRDAFVLRLRDGLRLRYVRLGSTPPT